jgi:ankyrin repeat protein
MAARQTAEEDGHGSPVLLAALKGQTAKLKRLIEAGCDVNQSDKNGATPAHAAAEEGQTVALALLIKAGCDVNQPANDGRRSSSRL